jgi:hypothetical protein
MSGICGRRSPCATLFLVLLFALRAAFADEGGTDPARTREFDFQIRTEGKIGDLVWYPNEVKIQERRINGKTQAFFGLPGASQTLAGGNLVYSTGSSTQMARVDETSGRFLLWIPSQEETVVLHFTAVDSYGKTRSEKTTLEIRSQETVRRFFADIGSSFSLLDYRENQAGTQVSVKELGLTVKGNIGYRLNARWDLSANAFGTAIPLMLSSSPTGMAPSRWYGLNGRMGYALYRSGLHTNVSLAFGWYFWGMISSPSENGRIYGVDQLSGPQMFLIYRSATRRQQAYFMYLKMAAIQSESGYHASNREWAIGGGFQPWRGSESAKKWGLTLDLAQTKFERFELLSFSVGASRRLW